MRSVEGMGTGIPAEAMSQNNINAGAVVWGNIITCERKGQAWCRAPIGQPLDPGWVCVELADLESLVLCDVVQETDGGGFIRVIYRPVKLEELPCVSPS